MTDPVFYPRISDGGKREMSLITRRQILVLIFLVYTATSLAADKSGPGTAIYEQFPSALRPLLKRAYADEIKRRTKIVGELKAAAAKAKGDQAKGTAGERLDSAKDSLDELKFNDPPFVGIQRNVTRETNGFTRLTWQIGDIGVDTDPDGLTVHQVIDENSAILRQKNDGGGEQYILLEGVDTKGWVDGDCYPINTAIWVSGTTTYKTAIGGSNTVLKAERFDWDKYRKSAGK